MNIEDYTIDTSAFAGLGNAATTASINLSNFADAISNTIFKLSDNGVTIFDNNGNSIIHLPGQIKVVFDTHEDGDCVEYGKENLWGDFEWDIDVATDEELSLFVKGG